ncbi:hypothetical protein KFE25_003029 [Diacronema lutheri]|uniref:Glycoside hydrolase family 5 domain-containing protein n=2 Tax=Diacronema lutheri TaxID=2081491 RepID=A0A8J5XCH6_DIALT|nr:hypothetical protein KFE25_003029 [Diacronema lutheri]
MSVRVLGILACLHAAHAAGVDQVVKGEFSADYDGGNDYYFEDPYDESLPPLPFETTPNMTCKSTRSRRFELPYHGVSLGGWMVLEPWITPSLFYQFLGTPEIYGSDAPQHTAVDMWSFCTVLGPEEANKQLRRHWQTWVTEDDLRKLHAMKINALRIPVGDWMWRPYGAYVNCTAGALHELDRVLDLAHAYGMRVLLDLHGVKDSQNGFDNSGRMAAIEWTQVPVMPPAGGVASSGAVQSTFSHWALQSPGWIGEFDRKKWKTVTLNWGNVDWAIGTLCLIAEMYKDHPAIFGLQPLNEPWQYTPIGPLKRYYFEGYKAVKRRAPKWKYVLSDSFRPVIDIWAPFMTGCPGVVLSTHLHQAWMAAQPLLNFLINACDSKRALAGLHEEAMEVIVGEFSLATDNCAMWLNGFNDNLPGYPVVDCAWVRCPPPYMGDEQPGCPPDEAKAEQGPFGTGMSTPRYGWCPVDRPWPDDDAATRRLALKKLNAFQGVSGWFFWNFKTELEPKWSYLAAVERGWMPRDPSAWNDGIENACNLEDRNGFKCQLKHQANPALIVKAIKYACNTTGMSVPYCYQDADYRLQHASKILTQYWRIHHREGATCDFDGIAELLPDWAYGSDPSDTMYGPRLLAPSGLRARLPLHAPLVAIGLAGLVFVGAVAARARAARSRRAADEYALREPLAAGARRVAEPGEADCAPVL